MVETIINLSEILFDFAAGFFEAYLSWLGNRFPLLDELFSGLLF